MGSDDIDNLKKWSTDKSWQIDFCMLQFMVSTINIFTLLKNFILFIRI